MSVALEMTRLIDNFLAVPRGPSVFEILCMALGWLQIINRYEASLQYVLGGRSAVLFCFHDPNVLFDEHLIKIFAYIHHD